MKKTKIEWCDSTWNPVTGCLHGCEYCYARNIARRFCHNSWNTVEDGINHFVGIPMQNEFYKNNKIDVYPYGFDPTFHRYRLGEPAKMTKPQTIFVCSMADLFGDWVPDEWILEVFKACENASRHRYLFLTKRPCRYIECHDKKILRTSDNYWYGSTVTTNSNLMFTDIAGDYNTFLSIEPIQERIIFDENRTLDGIKWVIIGAETGNRKDKIIPKKEWIDKIVEACYQADVPVFMKNSLIPIVGEKNMLREFPWERKMK